MLLLISGFISGFLLGNITLCYIAICCEIRDTNNVDFEWKSPRYILEFCLKQRQKNSRD